MGLIAGIDTVFYQVCNMERALGFYRDTLGLDLLHREGGDYALLSAGAINLTLTGELAVAPQKGGATVVFATTQHDDLIVALKAAGTVVGKVQDIGGGRSLDIYDPDGNELVVIEEATA